MSKLSLFVLPLALALSAATAACTSAESVGDNESAVNSKDPTADAGAPAEDAATDAGPSDTDAAVDAGPAAPGITGSNLELDLVSAGLDPRNLPAIADLDRTTRRKVMTTFTQALNVTCDFCHGGDAEADSHKEIASRMWSDYVQALKMKDGSALYCDSCHGGKSEFLDRSDMSKLRSWMGDNFVGKLERKDGAEHRCSTCHGSPFQGDIFKDIWHAE